MHVLCWNDDRAQSHGADERNSLQIYQQKFGAAGDDIHFQVNQGGAFDIHTPGKDDSGHAAVHLFRGDVHSKSSLYLPRIRKFQAMLTPKYEYGVTRSPDRSSCPPSWVTCST